jgi:hypothetical protein
MRVNGVCQRILTEMVSMGLAEWAEEHGVTLLFIKRRQAKIIFRFSNHIRIDLLYVFRFFSYLTEGYKKGYISSHHFENCGFLRMRE